MIFKRRPDAFYKRAKEEGYVARSAYKLAEIDRKYRIFRKGDSVLDLGAAPGSWLQYVLEKVGEEGLIVGVDQKPFRVSSSAIIKLIQADLSQLDVGEIQEHAKEFDAVISDLAPSTTGDRGGDHFRSMELCDLALQTAMKFLKQGGTFICKMYQGEESRKFLDRVRKSFELVKTQKPAASKYESREVYVVAIKRV